MVSDGDSRHPEPRRAIHQAVDFASAIEQAVIGVEMKMNKVFGRHPATILTETAQTQERIVTVVTVVERELGEKAAGPQRVTCSTSLGILGIPERAPSLGRFKVLGHQSHGTVVTVRIPSS